MSHTHTPLEVSAPASGPHPQYAYCVCGFIRLAWSDGSAIGWHEPSKEASEAAQAVFRWQEILNPMKEFPNPSNVSPRVG